MIFVILKFKSYSRQQELLKCRILFQKTENFKGKLQQDYKQLECKIFKVFWNMLVVVFQYFSICMVLPLRIQFHQCWFFKKHLLNACKITEFWPLSLQSAELYYISLAFLCWMENSCYIKLTHKLYSQNVCLLSGW